MTEAHDSDRGYVVLWGILLGALGISLVLGLLAGRGAAVAAIFAVALGKAALVLYRFMHLKDEPRWIRAIFYGALSVLAVLYVGLLPDIARVFG
ncbi:MAG: cytochrome C oxidase subunit IV family protein [Deltaproteobacteria bacterium]|nr:cytochrome C oxidase subunit IV family protein [Deltaproteobacteria bacterium]